MSKRSSVYFRAPLMALTSSLGSDDSVSGKLNRTAARYLEIIEHHGLALTKEESVILGNCLSGSESFLIRHLAEEIADSEYGDTKEAKVLIKKLQAAPFADLVAAVERLGF